MAVAGASAGHEGSDPHNLTTNLSSNNPFRNRAASPLQDTSSNGLSSQKPPQPARMSRNPFLDASEHGAGLTESAPDEKDKPVNTAAAALAADIFGDLSISDNNPPKGSAPPVRNGGPSHRTAPPPPHPDAPPHPPRRGPSPDKKTTGRPRRMSESSVHPARPMRRDREPGQRPERSESEERRRRQRRKEREERYRRQGRPLGKDGRTVRRPQGLDLIDQLDVTGIYGPGLFHHDGPFDACNPHRNKKHHKAPMHAFAAGSANMALGGSGPLRSNLDLDKFHGRGEESFTEWAATTRKADTAIINPLDRTLPVHGDETYGLGTSTFLEGAPASKRALQRRESEEPVLTSGAVAGGLSRKKSLAQRFRGMSGSRRQGSDTLSPDMRNSSDMDRSPPNLKAVSAGGRPQARYAMESEPNPFDRDYENAFDGTAAQSRFTEQANTSRPRAPSSPKPANGLIRTVTADADSRRPSSNDGEKSGFLNRMRSIKGGKRPRPERPVADA